jgi:hypothetical protein
MNVEFCNGNAFKIVANELKEKVMLECESLFGMKLKCDKLFGPQPVAVEIKDLPKLNQEEYMVCEKTDGSRAIFLLININNKPMCFLINRNLEYFFLDLSFKKEVYEGSIFDAELVKTKKGDWHLLIHDCMCYNGTSFLKSSHRLRYACIIDFIVKRYVNNPDKDPFNIKTKLFYNFGPGLEKTWEHIQETTENEIDGLIFTPVNGPYIFGRDLNLFKWKRPEDNTVDFQIVFKGRKVYLYYIQKSDLKLFKSFSSTHENYKKIKQFVKDIEDESPIIEFKIIDEDHFTPYRYRDDKNTPNGEITVLNTFKNVKEALQVKDLTSANPANHLATGLANGPSNLSLDSADLATSLGGLSLGSA